MVVRNQLRTIELRSGYPTFGELIHNFNLPLAAFADRVLDGIWLRVLRISDVRVTFMVQCEAHRVTNICLATR